MTNVMCQAKDKMVTSYFVAKLVKRIFWFLLPVCLILGITIITTTSGLSVVNLFITGLATIGLSQFLSELISRLVIINRISSADGQDVASIYFKIKRELEEMEKEKNDLETECPEKTLFFPAYIDNLSRTDPRKRLAKIKTKILLARTELNLFSY
ncbi:MAG: hypothetical protein WCK59_01770 [Candidatus Falkowbacteria bacterium]